MKIENTQNKARRFKIVVTDLQEDKTLMDVTTNAAIITAASPFDNRTNEDKEDCAQSAHYFNGRATDILNCIKSTIEGIGKTLGKHQGLRLLFNLWAMMKQLENEEEDEDERSVAKADYEAKSKNQGDDINAN